MSSSDPSHTLQLFATQVPYSVVELWDYNLRSIAVFGKNGTDKTKAYRKALSSIKGIYNKALKYRLSNGTEIKIGGWIYSKTKFEEVRDLVNRINTGQEEEGEYDTDKKSNVNNNTSSFKNETNTVSPHHIANLVSRIERLEQESANIRMFMNNLIPMTQHKQVSDPMKAFQNKSSAAIEFVTDDDDNEEQVPARRLIKLNKSE